MLDKYRFIFSALKVCWVCVCVFVGHRPQRARCMWSWCTGWSGASAVQSAERKVQNSSWPPFSSWKRHQQVKGEDTWPRRLSGNAHWRVFIILLLEPNLRWSDKNKNLRLLMNWVTAAGEMLKQRKSAELQLTLTGRKWKRESLLTK